MVHPQTLDQTLLKKESSWNGASLSFSVCGHVHAVVLIHVYAHVAVNWTYHEWALI